MPWILDGGDALDDVEFDHLALGVELRQAIERHRLDDALDRLAWRQPREHFAARRRAQLRQDLLVLSREALRRIGTASQREERENGGN
jgi:hypothetical protein